MRTHVYLTPMAPDGTPGEVKEMQVSDEAPQYLEPYAENDDTAKLRHQVHEAQSKLQHAKARGKGVAEAQKALEDAKSAAGKAHRGQQQARTQQRTGVDYGAPSPFSRDTRQFMEPVPYFTRNDYDGNDTTGRTFDDEVDDELEAKILAAVEALETAQSDGASWAEVLRLEAALKVLRDQLPNPSAPPAVTKAAPPRKEHITRPAPLQPTGQTAARQDRARRGAWILARAAELLSKNTNAANVCCEGQHLCAKCQAKKAAAA
jgi:hypothetical protein